MRRKALPDYSGTLTQACFAKRNTTVPATAKYVGRLLIPKPLSDGRLPLVDIYSEPTWTYLTVAGKRDCVLGAASHGDDCAWEASGYRRIHAVDGVGITGGGFGFALYLGAALAQEMRGARGVFSIPLSEPRRQTRSHEAESLWNRMKSGEKPIAHTFSAEVACCDGDDFTPQERKSRKYKQWLKESEDYDQPLYMIRDIDTIDGEDVRQSGYVVELAKVPPATVHSLRSEYEAVLPKLTAYYEDLPDGPEKLALTKADDAFHHEGKPEALIRIAQRIVPGSFPSFGKVQKKLADTPWASFKPVARGLYLRAFKGARPQQSLGAIEPVRAEDVTQEDAEKRLQGQNLQVRAIHVRTEWKGQTSWISTYGGFSGDRLIGYFTRRRDGKLRWHDASPYFPPVEGHDWRSA